MTSSVTSQAPTGSLGKLGIEHSQTPSGGVCPSLHLHLRLQPPASSENKSLSIYPTEGLGCSSPGKHAERASLPLTPAGHSQPSIRESQQPFHIHQNCSSSLMCRPSKRNGPACKVLHRTPHFPDSPPWAPPVYTGCLTLPRMPTLDHIPRPTLYYLGCSPVLPEYSYTTSSTPIFLTPGMCHAPKATVELSGQ